MTTILDCIGETPLVTLRRIVPQAHATVQAKLEFLSPTGSIKDRIAKHIILKAEREGRLKPGGTIAILEFTEPPDNLFGNLYRWYFRTVLPRIGAAISGDSTAYTYLPKSVSRFFRPPELAALMTQVGYQSVAFKSWTLGTVAIHTASRPV